MRADRLVSIVLLLQTNDRMTAAQLAQRLEVSERTIMRDMDALSSAGVPLFSERGTGGGWELLEPYRTDLTGMRRDEIRALFLAIPPALLDDLGLRQAYEAAQIKLQAALSATEQQRIEDFRERILIDMPGWRPSKSEDQCFHVIQHAVLPGLRLKIVYQRVDADPVEREVDPLGLVAKGNVWYLIAGVGGEPRTYRISRVVDAQALAEPAQRPEGFNLARFWADSSRDFVAQLPRYPAKVRVAPDWLNRMYGWWRYAHIDHVGEPDAQGWCLVDVTFDVLEIAAGNVLSFGPNAEPVEPEELKTLVSDWAKSVAVKAP